MRKRISYIAIIVLAMTSIIFMILTYVEHKKNTNLHEEYIIFNDGLYVDNQNAFVQCELRVEAIELKKQIGVTTENQQIYSIKGLDPNEYICMRENGNEIIYRNTDTDIISAISELSVNEIEVRDQNGIELLFSTSEKQVVNNLVSFAVDENIVEGDVNAEKIKKLTLLSDKYKGLCYVVYYIIDENSEHYLYDVEKEIMWKLPTAIFEE